MSSIQSKPALFAAFFVASMLSAPLAWAAPEYHVRPKNPPPGAIEACADLAKGDACSIAGRRDERISGTCDVFPAGDGLACAPEEGPPGNGRRPE